MSESQSRPLPQRARAVSTTAQHGIAQGMVWHAADPTGAPAEARQGHADVALGAAEFHESVTASSPKRSPVTSPGAAKAPASFALQSVTLLAPSPLLSMPVVELNGLAEASCVIVPTVKW